MQHSYHDKRINVFIADDHPVFRGGLRRILETDTGLNVIGEAADGEQTVALTRELRPDVLLLDVAMPKLTGIQVLAELNSIPLPMHTILVTGWIERKQTIEALQLGMRGLILKSAGPETYLKAVRCVHKGELWVERDVLTAWARSKADTSQRRSGLTPREVEIVGQILAGSSNKEIAAKLTIAEHTVKRHLSNVYEKLGVATRLELSLFALHHHLLQ